MSKASKITLGASVGGAVGIFYYVHAKQQSDIQKMHEGVIRDKTRQEIREMEKAHTLEQRKAVTKLMEETKQK